jgi:predicted AAA+ superfamily ATPase
MIIGRHAGHLILKRAGWYPIVVVSGPRHAGKTTLLRMLFKYHNYVNLDNPDMREFARRNPRDFIRYHLCRPGFRGLFIDEFRRVPELSGHIRTFAQHAKRPGMFILATSHWPHLKFGINRLPEAKLYYMQTLLPLSIGELRKRGIELGSRDDYIHRGFMPRIYGTQADPQHIIRNYLTFYVERDLRQFLNLDDKARAAFKKMLKLLARRIGQIINPDTLAKSVGVPRETLSAWLSALEASYITFRLPSYYSMQSAKTPKLYFTDVGMAAFLLGIRTADQVFRDPMVGSLFENMVVADALKCRYNLGLSTNLSYFRNTDFELDLLIQQEYNYLPIEIKCSSAYSAAFAKNVKMFRKMSLQTRAGYVVYSGDTKVWRGERTKFVNFKEIGGIV